MSSFYVIRNNFLDLKINNKAIRYVPVQTFK